MFISDNKEIAFIQLYLTQAKQQTMKEMQRQKDCFGDLETLLYH